MRTLAVWVLCATATAFAQAPQKNIVRFVGGTELYRSHCAACHGQDGRGQGPASRYLKTPPPDLTIIARHNKGVFPLERIEKIIAGEETIASHGTRQMPVWGPLFSNIENDLDLHKVRLRNLAKFIESIQKK
jgi:mono/diheme cytochrome c family protein